MFPGFAQNQGNSGGMGGGGQGGGDSLNLKHRVDTRYYVTYHYLDGVSILKPDSTYNDFYAWNPLKSGMAYLGNIGNPAYPLVYQPRLQPGWDPGLHALDPYRFMLDSTRFYHTSAPYTELGYLVGSQQEQIIKVLHVQSPSPNLSFGFQFRKINSDGFFKNQNTDDNGYRLFAHYHTDNVRYNVFFSFTGNKLNNGENGGILSDAYLSNPVYSDLQTIPVNLGGNNTSNFSIFSSSIPTRSYVTDGGVLIRQSYDWGKSDTVQVNDSTQRYLFYPVLRIEHTFRYLQQVYGFSDTIPSDSFYFAKYGLEASSLGALNAVQKWNSVSNDFSIMQFPIPTNQSQYLRAGITLESDKGYFIYNSISFSNLYGHFEYRNKTKNQLWDMDLYGSLYLAGSYFGNYKASASLSRKISNKIGNVRLAFVNVNETPPFAFSFFESNRLLVYNHFLKNENTTLLQFSSGSSKLGYHLELNYYLLNNYTYFSQYAQSAQFPGAFNLVQIILDKQFKLRHFHWYADIAYQQVLANTPLHVPQIWTRERLDWEGALFAAHLGLATGLDMQYNTAYPADDYSPLLQQFVEQSSLSIANVPELGAFVNILIRRFTAFIRADNLNTFVHSENFAAPLYPYGGFNFQIGIKWLYIN